jgi:hypothetical protein
VVGGAKFPRVGQIDGQHFTGPQSGSNQAARQAFYGFAIFRVGEAAGRRTRSVHHGKLPAKTAAGLKDGVVEENAVGISVETGAH